MILKIPIKNRYIVSVLLGLCTFVLVLAASGMFPRSFEEWEEKSLDYRFRLRPEIPHHPSITTIGVEDESLEKIGVWPWDRSIHGRLVNLLTQWDVACINFDIFFPSRSSEAGDAQFIEAVRDAGNVILAAPFELIEHPCFTPQEYRQFTRRFPEADSIIADLKTQENGMICVDFNRLSNEQWNALGQKAAFELLYHARFAFTGPADREKLEVLLTEFQYPFTITRPETLWYGNRALMPLKALSRAASGLGHVSATPDSDGVFRRIPLAIRVQGRLFPHMTLAAVLHYLDVPPEDVEIVPGKHILLPDAHFPDSDETRDIKIPVDERLNLRINFPTSWSAHSYADVLVAEADSEAANFWRQELQGQICTIGYLVTGTGDIGPTPLETNFPLALIHAAILNTILTQNFLYEIGWGPTIGITLVLVIALALVAPRVGPYHFTLVVVATLVGYVGVAIGLFNGFGVILKLLNPVLPTIVLEYTLITVYWYATEDRERRQLRSAFKTYVSKQMLAQILDNPESLALQGQRKELTIMFSDVRKFSTLSDQIEPEAIHRLLNLYFSRMTNIAFKYDGFVDKFIGDGLLCFFGDPIAHSDHAWRAVQAAIEMQQAVRELGPAIRETLKLEPIVIRIGINTGPVIVGNMGSAERMEYTVLGSEVNLAQRLEASATPGQIMISWKTYEHVKDQVQVRNGGNIHVKGFERPIQVYEIELPFD
jgi:adenylate cyclase